MLHLGVRQKHEMNPYVTIVWELMGGQKTFDSLLPLWTSGDVEGWDREARSILKKQVDADDETLTSLLELFLAKKNQLQSIRIQKSKWRMSVITQKMEN